MSPKIIVPTLILAGAAVGLLWRDVASHPEVSPVPSLALATDAPVLAELTPEPNQNQAFIMPAVQPAYVPAREQGVSDPAPNANAALVYHVETDRVLFAKNESVRAPIASLTKILTAMVVHDQLEPSDIVTVSSGSVRVDGIRQTLNEGERITVDDLVKLMLVESSNDAAYALAAHARTRGFDLVARMNELASDLGMSNSSFTNPAGLDDKAYSTPNDLVRLVRAALGKPYRQIWEVMLNPSVTVESVDKSFTHVASNTNQLLGRWAGIRWAKTGNTDGALGCLLMVVKTPQDSDTLVSIVLGSQQRFEDTELLIGWASSAYDWF